MDGQTARGAGRASSERGDLGGGGSPAAWADPGRDRRLAGEFSPGGRERRPRDEEALKDEQIKKKLKQKIGDLVLDNDILREALKPYPLERKTSDA